MYKKVCCRKFWVSTNELFPWAIIVRSIETFKKRYTVHLRITSKGLEEADTRGDAILLLALDSFNSTMA